MAIANTLPTYWYIENKYSEVRNFLEKEYGYGNTPFWERFTWIGYVPEKSTTYRGVFACEDESSMYIHKAQRISIKEFKAMSRKEEIINNYEIY